MLVAKGVSLMPRSTTNQNSRNVWVALLGYHLIHPCQMMVILISCWVMTLLAFDHTSWSITRVVTWRDKMWLLTTGFLEAGVLWKTHLTLCPKDGESSCQQCNKNKVTAQIIVEACVCLHNFMRMRNPAVQNIQLDGEYNLIPCAWR